MRKAPARPFTLLAISIPLLLLAVAARAQERPYAVVDTNQAKCYGNSAEVACPSPGQPFYGQDAQHAGNAPQYSVGADGLTVYDAATGLTWQKSPETNGDGTLNSSDKLTWTDAQARPAILNAAKFGGHEDWRVPTIKELYSLIDFRGTDPSLMSGDTSGLTPFVDRAYFDFAYGDTNSGERVIDAQYWSSTAYVSTTMGGNATQFGVNFADGRIKGYPRDTGPGGSPFKEFLRCVRGNPSYGKNQFEDNGDGTVTDAATGLIWTLEDSGEGMTWEEALAWAQARNAENYLGHGDWRLPEAKELQSLVDYTRSPDTTGSAAIDPVFDVTPITNEGGAADFPWYWSSTTHASSNGTGVAGAYVCFGRCLGWMKVGSASCYSLLDVHGAGAQRSDPKSGSPSSYALGTACSGGTAYGRGPQGDVVRVDNFVRLVRDAGGQGALSASFTYAPAAPTDAAPVTFTASASGGTGPYSYTWDLGGTAASGSTASKTFTSGTHTVALTARDAAGASATAARQIDVAASVTVTGVSASSDPFKLKVSGANFLPGCTVQVEGTPAPTTLYKSATQAVAKGNGLKAMVPKGVTVRISVANPDGSTSAPFSYTR